MERKLSQKATRMRQRLTFSRNNQGRNRASTMNSSETASNTPSSRPRSSTTPDTSTPAESAWDNADATRCYTFTDEPGYFRPPSPLIDRQLIEEDLEDNVKHACALLVQSVDRGVPMWPPLQSEVQPKYSVEENMAHALTGETRHGQDQPQHSFTHLLPPTALDTAIRVCKSQHDSGVAMSFHSVGHPSKTNPTSLSASIGHGRFYGKRQPTSPSAKESFDRGRARGHSFATDTPSLRSRTPSQSRSRSSSPALFPYSPPQLNAQWTPSNDHDSEPLDTPLPETKTASFLGVEGTTWPRASLDLPRPREHDARMTSAPGTSTGPPASSPAPRRFYSTRQAPRKRTSEWPAAELDSSSRDSLADYGGLATDSLVQPPHDFPFRPWTGQDARPFQMAGVESHENVYSIVIPAETGPRHRRKRASHLLKKLAGLGMRRKEGETSEGRRVGRAVAVAG
ncbi:uncharacterized protein N7459_008031 [Penicillium hispanicum]|uniref:uncharacterized protein n=1 Tax=Penicillium hispanicum TaxID=1080232 RepID=UPI002541A204|nr:uncharacterized protein N7459_008031 [Penicillium hispanicum]KAJ5573604.1 hypothetical protein N7459_008031 [Penicillium hispanicum]